MFLLKGYKGQNRRIFFMANRTLLKLIHTERMGIRGFNFVPTKLYSSCFKFRNGKDFHKSIFCMHGISRLCVLRKLLDIEYKARIISQKFKVGLFNVRDRLSLHKNCSLAFPLAFEHECKLFELFFLHYLNYK